MRRVFVFLSVLLLPVGVSPVNAQKQCAPDCVPADLAAALLEPMGTADDVDVSVGELPEGLPNDFVLPDTGQVVGGAQLGGPRGFGAAAAGRGPERRVVIATAPRSPEEIRAEYSQSLSEKGWTPKELGMRGQSIFQSNASRFPQTFCREGSMLRLALSRHGDDGSQLRIEHWTGGKTSALCDMGVGPPQPKRDVPMPSLKAPTDAKVQPDVGRFAGESVVEYTTIETHLSVSEVVSHYAAELKKEEWTKRSVSEGEETTTQVWQLEDESGQLWMGLLVAMNLPSPSTKNVLFHITKQ